jgi:moderate conductance mechanosensitive channel
MCVQTASLSEIRSSTKRASEPERTSNLAILATLDARSCNRIITALHADARPRLKAVSRRGRPENGEDVASVRRLNDDLQLMLAGLSVLAASAPTQLIDPSQATCSTGTGGAICRWVYEATGSQLAADITLWVVEKPLKIALILVLAWAAIWVGKRAAHAFVVSLPKHIPLPGPAEDAAAQLREQQRNTSVERLLVSLIRFTAWFIAAVMVLDVLGINVTPLLVSAGIIGLAVSFGAQTLVRDMIGGISIIVDRRLAVGDVIDVADAAGRIGTTGTVEAVGLSSTTLRDSLGEIWHVPNGDIRWIGNLSERWARIVIDVRIGYGTDLRAAKDAFAAAIALVVEDERYRDGVLEPPVEPFVQELAVDAAVLRATLRVDRNQLDAIRATALETVAQALPDAGLGPAPPRQIVHVERPSAIEA